MIKYIGVSLVVIVAAEASPLLEFANQVELPSLSLTGARPKWPSPLGDAPSIPESSRVPFRERAPSAPAVPRDGFLVTPPGNVDFKLRVITPSERVDYKLTVRP